MKSVAGTLLTPDSMRDIIKEEIQEQFGQPPGGGGSDMEARIAKLEASVSHIETDIKDIKTDLRGFKTDIKTEIHEFRKEVNARFLDITSQFRWQIGLFLTAFLALLGAMAKGFGWL